jgi:predicted metal-dependent RNase
MGRSKSKTKISFVGESAQSVTGSMYHINYKSNNILLSCGYYQCKDKLKQYQVNNRDLKFKVKEIDTIVIEQNHLDHYGLHLTPNTC